MKFISLSDIRSMFGFGRSSRYDKTPQSKGVTILMNGQTEMLDPENIDAYDVYSTTDHLQAVIKRKGDLLASGQWKHKQRKGNDVIDLERSPVVNILENPNVLYNGNDYIRLLNENRCVYGNEYKYLIKSSLEVLPRAIFVLPSFDVRVNTTGKWYNQLKMDDIVKSYELISTNDVLDFNSISHTWIQNSKNPLIGETPLKAIYMAISNLRVGMKFRNVIMKEKGALGILSNNAKDTIGSINIGTEERERIEKQYRKDYGIEDGQSKVIISDHALRWQSMSYPTKDLMLFEEDENDFQKICSAYGISRDLFPQVNKATYTNQQEAIRQTYQTTIIPEAEELAMHHTRLLGLDGVNEWLELDYSHIPALQANEKEKAEVVKLNSDAITTLRGAGFDDNQITAITGITL